MDGNDSDKHQERSSGRPTGAGEDTEAEVFTLPGVAGGDAGDPASNDDGGVADSDTTAAKRSELDDYTSAEYGASTTQEYQGLAEEVSRAAEEEWQLQAVAATVPGVDRGLVGFDDVTGTVTDPEEHYEATEQAATSDLTMRIGSGLIIFGMFLGSLLLGGWWFTGFVALVMVVGAGEFYAALRSNGYSPLALFGLLGVLAMAIGARMSGPAAIAGWAAFFAVATVLFFSLSPRRNPLENASTTIVGLVWAGLLSFAVLIAKGPHPVAYILFVVLVIAFNDTGAYFVGRSMGRRKLAPVISPNKTVEGVIGGLLVALIISAVLTTFPAWEEIGLAQGMVTAALVGVVSPIGDAIESMVKRSVGIKDMGSVLPGHGGILDRIDSFLLAVPAVYYLFRGFGLL
jgi:phosphatidate cytidylyltransferase